MKKVIILLCASILLVTNAYSQATKPRLSLEQVKDSIAVIMKQEHIVGLMLGIANKDSVLFTGGFGYADLEAKKAVNQHTLFRMGSITKMFVSLGILKLVEEGKLNLNDKLKDIAPDVPFENAWEATHPVRIVHLLEHTSGFDDIKLNRMYALGGQGNQGKAMMMVHEKSYVCRWKPGERMAYANPNYAVLGYVIQKITGKLYEQYLTETILKPLSMSHSNFNLNSKKPQLDVKEYIFQSNQIKKVPSVTLLSGPQGALWSSAEEMCKFLQLFLRNGDSLIRKSSIDEMETPHSSLAATKGLKTCYALANRTSFLKMAYAMRGHDGLTGTCYSSFNYNRDLNIGFVVASNSNQSNFRIEQLIVKYLEHNLPNTNASQALKPLALDQHAIEPYLGLYEFDSPRNELAGFRDKLLDAPHIYLENGKLFYKPLMGGASELVQTGPLTFAWSDMNAPLIVFTTNAEGKRVFLIAGSYYEQTSYWGGMAKRLLWALAVIFALLTYVLGLVSLIQFVRKKHIANELVLRILPAIGVSLLLWGVFNVLEVQEFTYLLYEFDSMNVRTLIIFGGTLSFGIISVVFLLITIQRFRNTKATWFNWYLLLTALSLCSIALLLWQSGWIGMMTWTAG